MQARYYGMGGLSCVTVHGDVGIFPYICLLIMLTAQYDIGTPITLYFRAVNRLRIKICIESLGFFVAPQPLPKPRKMFNFLFANTHAH